MPQTDIATMVPTSDTGEYSYYLQSYLQDCFYSNAPHCVCCKAMAVGANARYFVTFWRSRPLNAVKLCPACCEDIAQRAHIHIYS